VSRRHARVRAPQRDTLTLMQTILNRRQLMQVAVAASAIGATAQSQDKKPMRLGVVASLSKDPDASIKRVHELGFPTCQLSIGAFDDGTVAGLRAAMAKYGVEVTSAIAGGPGPEIYDFYKAPASKKFRILQRRPVSRASRRTAGFCRKIPMRHSTPKGWKQYAR
jgi:hypothetical protein